MGNKIGGSCSSHGNTRSTHEILSPKANSLRFLCVGLDEGLSLQKKGGYTGRNAGSHFGRFCPHK